ncbi:unnamed protein product, partial [Musa banksii]
MAARFGLAGGIPESWVRPIRDADDSRESKAAFKLATGLCCQVQYTGRKRDGWKEGKRGRRGMRGMRRRDSPLAPPHLLSFSSPLSPLFLPSPLLSPSSLLFPLTLPLLPLLSSSPLYFPPLPPPFLTPQSLTTQLHWKARHHSTVMPLQPKVAPPRSFLCNFLMAVGRSCSLKNTAAALARGSLACFVLPRSSSKNQRR